MAGEESSEKELWKSGYLVPCTGRQTPVEEEEEVQARDRLKSPCETRRIRPALAGEEGSEKELWLSGCLMPCTGRRTQVEEEEKEVQASKSRGSGRASPIHGSAAMEKVEIVIGAKRKAEIAEKVTAAAAGGSSKEGKAAAADGTSEVATIDVGKLPAQQVKWVEMPVEYLDWLLAQKREDYRIHVADDYGQGDPEKQELIRRMNAANDADYDDFFKFQAWVRHTLEKKGCVMVPEGFPGRNAFDYQDELDEEWENARQELGWVDE